MTTILGEHGERIKAVRIVGQFLFDGRTYPAGSFVVLTPGRRTVLTTHEIRQRYVVLEW